MSNREDRYHTTSWDVRQVQRQQAPSGGPASRSQQPSRPASGGQQGSKKKKAKKRRGMNPILGILLWVVIVVSSSAIFAGVGWMLANDFCAFNKAPLETTVEIPEEWFTETEVTGEDGTAETVSTVDIEKVAQALKEEGLIEYPWFFRLFSTFYKSAEKIKPGTYTLNTEMDYMALVRGMRTTTTTAATVEVSIPEGYSTQQIFALLEENGVCSVEELNDAAANYEFQDYAFLSSELLGQTTRVEGYLYPDTYEFYVGRSLVVGKPVAMMLLAEHHHRFPHREGDRRHGPGEDRLRHLQPAGERRRDRLLSPDRRVPGLCRRAPSHPGGL